CAGPACRSTSTHARWARTTSARSAWGGRRPGRVRRRRARCSAPRWACATAPSCTYSPSPSGSMSGPRRSRRRWAESASTSEALSRSAGMGSPDRSTSLTLLERLRGRDEAAWHNLLRLYAPLVDRWCGHCGVRGQDADDVRQEVFQAVALGLDNFRREEKGDT